MIVIWRAVSNEEVSVESVLIGTHHETTYYEIGNLIEMSDGRAFGVTQSGRMKTALCVPAKKKTPMEMFP